MLATVVIPGYELTETIHSGVNTVIYRGKSLQQQQSVILKVLKDEYPTLDQITRLKHEYKMTQNLDNGGIVKVYRLETHQNRLVLVCEDFGGVSLKQQLSGKALNLNSFLRIAIGLAQALEYLHQHQIIHKDIKPANIIINPQTGIVKLTDFSIASSLARITPQIINPNQIEGTLAYMSPEQTGRMNRIVDYRSDFYSLGVTFYEILTGKLPFLSDDPLEIVHCHIAKLPFPIQKLNLEIPDAIASIIMKLMAKNAEDRYQTSQGLLADLEICQQQLTISGKITQFTPGRLDILGQLLIPQKLYGREKQVDSLLQAFERVSQGSCEIMLVSGYSGIGKSSVVNEVNKPIIHSRGYFISGKFDQFKRNIPYASLIQAFGSFMGQLLTESAAKLDAWRTKILQALGVNGQVIIDVIPEVELIIGSQPEVAQLGPTESQNRFNRVFTQFISVFTQKEHPLVIFLDDLQWADSATLNLMQLLLTEQDSKYLLLIGAYRDNEVSPTHPLMHTVEEIQKADAVVNNVVLQPLDLETVNELVTDTLNQTEIVKPLAELLWNKTGGNPFFLTQLLSALYQEKLLNFDFGLAAWQWNLSEIQAIGITDKSVVELVASRIEKLPPETQEVLKLAACIGDRFSLDVLAIVNEKSASTTAIDLYLALQVGLILPMSEAYKIPLVFQQESVNFSFDTKRVAYRFLHDRVQQAAYSLIPESDKKATHLKIGQSLLKNTPTQEIEAHIFDIVNQLNVGIDTISQQLEKDELARLNLIAGRKAKAAAAYEPALNYLIVGKELLSSNCWDDYELSLALYESAAEAAYLTGNFEQMEKDVFVVLQQAKTILDKVKVYELKIVTCMAQAQQKEAVNIGLQVLELLGVIFPKSPSFADIQEKLAETALNLQQIAIEDLINLPEMTDPEKKAAMPILLRLVSASFQAAPVLLPLIVCEQVNLSLKHGNASESAYAYGSYGLILCGVVGDIETGYEFGKLALNLLQNSNIKEHEAKIYLMAYGAIKFWKEHISETLKPLVAGYSSGLETGDLESAAILTCMYCYHSYYIGKELTELEREIATYCQAVAQIKQEGISNYNKIFLQVVFNLQGRNENPCSLIGEAYNEEKMLTLHQQGNERTGLFFLYFNKLILCYLFGEHSQAVENAASAEQYLDGVTAQSSVAVFHFYNSLTLLAVYPDSNEQQSILEKVQASQQKMQQWANHAPMNFQHKYDLVDAELARIFGDVVAAMNAYDRAIQGAKENGYIQEEALANELAAQFYLELGKTKIAKTYMTEAYYSYMHWGAIAKVKHLDERYPNLIIRSYNPKATTDITQTIATTKTATTTSNTSGILDLATVIKASQAIASEILLEKLLLRLLNIILENAGAEKGCLILVKDNQLFIEATISNQEFGVILQSTPVESSEDIPITIVNYVARTQEYVILNDAVSEIQNRQSKIQNFNDSYILRYQPKSILCAPIFYQSKLTGIFYLENNLATGAFTRDRWEVLKLLTSQAAIAIENARLYAREQEKAQQLQESFQKLQQTQAQLVQTEKISSLGQLVAGVAHEVNNPTSFIAGNLSHASEYIADLVEHLALYQEHYPNPVPQIEENAEDIDLEFLLSDLPKMISSMKLGTDRIRDIMQSLRNFSRADGSNKKAVDIHQGLETTLMILQHRLKPKPECPAILVKKNYGNLPQVKCYAGQLNQVFMNLLANAIDALEESNKGKTFGEIELNPNTITIDTTAKDDCVTIRIADNGLGMSEQVRQQLFDPFFTTKAEGKGTGLGLSISYQIVTQHTGTMECFSSLGQGAEFVIKIPLT